MIKIEVISTDITKKAGTSTRTGKAYSIREQDAWAYLFDRQGAADPHPTKIRLNLEDDQLPYPKGMYVLDKTSFFVDRYGQLTIGRMNIAPLPVSQAPAAPVQTATRAA